MTWRDLGKEIQRLREARGLTQAQLAQLSDLSTVYVQKLELGERLSPSFPALERLAKALGVTLEIRLAVKPERRKRRI